MKIVIDTEAAPHKRCVVYDGDGVEQIKVPFFTIELSTAYETFRRARWPDKKFRNAFFKQHPGIDLTEEMLKEERG